MIKKSLHTGNIAASLALVATAADLTLTGGLVTTIGMALSGLELFKKADKATRTLAKSIADKVQGHLGQSHLTPDRKKITVQMLALFPRRKPIWPKATWWPRLSPPICASR